MAVGSPIECGKRSKRIHLDVSVSIALSNIYAQNGHNEDRGKG